MSDGHTITGKIRRFRNDKSAIRRFGRIMLLKLRLNSHKAHWKTVDEQYLHDRAGEELFELFDALNEWEAHRGDIHEAELAKAVQLECADVANFVMMISDNVAKKSL